MAFCLFYINKKRVLYRDEKRTDDSLLNFMYCILFTKLVLGLTSLDLSLMTSLYYTLGKAINKEVEALPSHPYTIPFTRP